MNFKNPSKQVSQSNNTLGGSYNFFKDMIKKIQDLNYLFKNSKR